MKRIVLALVLAAALPALAAADVVIRSVHRIETIVDGQVQDTQEQGKETLWIGKDRLDYRSPQMRIVLDRERGTVLFADPAKKLCLERPLPLDAAELRETLETAGYKVPRSSGKVQATERKRKILDLDCREYEVESWQFDGETPKEPNRFVVCAITELPYEADLSLVADMLTCLRAFFNRDEAYRKALRAIEGVQLYLVADMGPGQRYVEEAVAIAEQEPPAGTYGIPPGYRRLTQ